MPEYIERKATIDFVKQNTPNFGGETSIRCVERALKNVPTADVVKVVRCKDCKHCESYYPKKVKGEEPEIAYYCDLLEYPTEPTHFCSYGELKEVSGNEKICCAFLPR